MKKNSVYCRRCYKIIKLLCKNVTTILSKMEENVRKVSSFGKCGKRVLAVMMIFAMAVSSGTPKTEVYAEEQPVSPAGINEEVPGTDGRTTAGSDSGADGRTDCCTTEHIGGKKEKMLVPKENL